jgi:predicted small lipoprotein YifL
MQATLASAGRSGMVRVICKPASKIGVFAGGQFGDNWGGGVQVKKSVDRWSRLALAAAMMAALGLAACGRKGGLDPPPSAGLTTPQSSASRPSLGEETTNGFTPPPAEDRARTASAAPAAATASSPPPKKTFFLDFLLAR